MGWKIWQQDGVKKLLLLSSATVTQPFHILTTTLLSLILPFSFLLLARISTAHYLLKTSHPSSLSLSLFLYTNPTLLHTLVSLITIASLIHSLTGPITPIFRPSLFIAWIFLCTLQICVGLGIEASIVAGIDGSGFGHKRSLLSEVVFFLGLHETMLYWWRTVVKPVVDDTAFGYAKEERWVERVAVAASFGGMWWWRLKDEVESLVVVAVVEKEVGMGVGVTEFVGWWLYYLIVTIGMVRIVKGIVWVPVMLLCWRRRVEEANQGDGDSRGNEDKV